MDSRFRMIYHVGAGYAIPNAEDTPYIEELARQEGILLDPVYTGKAWTKFLMLVKEGYFDGQEHIAFVHTGGAAALFAWAHSGLYLEYSYLAKELSAYVR